MLYSYTYIYIHTYIHTYIHIHTRNYCRFCFTLNYKWHDRERTPGRHEPLLCRHRASTMQTKPTLCIFLNPWFLWVMTTFNNFFWRSGIRIVMIRNIYGLIKWFIRFILKLLTFLTQKGRYLEKYFWSKLGLFCCNLWFKQYLFFEKC